MALSAQTYVGDGVTQEFVLSFALGYIAEAHIYVYVDGQEVPQNTLTFTQSGTLVRTPNIPAVDAKVLVRRIMPNSELIHDFTNGALVLEKSLDEGNMQAIMLQHEAIDGFLSTGQGSNLDMGGHGIINLRDAVNDNDAVPFKQIKQYEDAVKLTGQQAEASITAVHNQAVLDIQQGVADVTAIRDEVLLLKDEVEVAPRQNLLINGDFSIKQRAGTSFTNSYCFDRWHCTAVQDTVAHRPFTALTRLDYTKDYKGSFGAVTTVDNTPNRITFLQRIENHALLGGVGAPYTLSFFLGHSATTRDAKIHVAISEANTSNNFTTVTNRHNHYIAVGTGSVNNMTKYTITFNADFNLCTNGMEVSITLQTDGSFLPLFASTGTVELGGTKLEIGSLATGFAPDDASTNLAKCQRYYEVGNKNRYAYNILPANPSYFIVDLMYTVTKRIGAVPSITTHNWANVLSSEHTPEGCHLYGSTINSAEVSYLTGWVVDAEL